MPGFSFRYRDIVILLRDPTPTPVLLREGLADHGSGFLDHKRTAIPPLVEPIRPALEKLIRNGLDPVFRYLKTDLTPLSREEVTCWRITCLPTIGGAADVTTRDYRRRLTRRRTGRPPKRSRRTDRLMSLRRQASQPWLLLPEAGQAAT